MRSTGLALALAFAAFGFMFGSWQVVLPDLSGALGLEPGPLGLALSAGFVVSLPLMAGAGRMIDRYGAPRGMAVAGGALGAAVLGYLLVGDFPFLVVLLTIFMACAGLYDVAINAAAIDHEQRTGQRVFANLHAAFSGGGLVGALAAGIALSGGVPFRLVYVIAGVAVAVAALGSARLLFVRVAEPLDRAIAGPDDGARGPGTPRPLYREPALLLLAAIVALALLGEGAMESWSAIYLRSVLGLSALLGATGVAIFHGAMAVGRLSGGALIARFGRVATLALAGATSALGMSLALITVQPPLVLSGFLIVALGLSVVVPAAFSLGGDRAAGRSGSATALLWSIGYGGFVVGPALVGTVAQLTSLRLGLGLVLLAGLGIVALSRGFSRLTQRPAVELAPA